MIWMWRLRGGRVLIDLFLGVKRNSFLVAAGFKMEEYW